MKITAKGGGMFRREYVFVGVFCLSLFAQGGDFPIGPDLKMTPGSYCTSPDSYRYPERIPYCSRSVSREVKWQVIEQYNKTGGYSINEKNRAEFKIDHLIPLCAGGSNQPDNLWPQHKSLFAQTDPLEPLACDKMKTGALKQSHAAELLMRAKKDLSQIPAVMAELERL